jgi:GrpB-like predicted nucleotidyltransferase (UPF0157 family)
VAQEKGGGVRSGDMPQPIVIVRYNPQWPSMYEGEKERILVAVGHLILAIEHIGSTAVPGLGAKPIIDMMAAVRRMSDSLECIKPLKELGYDHYFYPEFPERCVFIDGTIGGSSHHLHMTEYMSGFWKDKISFRDYLRAHVDVAQEYYRLKLEWAEKYGSDREEYLDYTNAKNGFIAAVLEKAKG